MVELTIVRGPYRLRIEAERLKELWPEAALFAALPDKCPECEAGVRLTYRTPQTYEYFGLECLGPAKHSTNFGIHKDGKSLFYKDGERWKSYSERVGEEF